MKAKRDAMTEEDVLLSSFLNDISDKKDNSKSDEDVLLNFFSEVTNASADKPAANIDKEKLLTDKYANQDLGDAKEQYERLIAPHYEWKNLNPYFVLQLDIDATEEDIKNRYNYDEKD
jgi:hypothetical protein